MGALPERGTIAISFVREALVVLRERGVDCDELLGRAGIAPALLALPEARVSVGNYAKLWHLTAEVLDDEFFGMDSHGMKAGSFTLLCHAVIHARNLERGLARAMRFLRVVLDDLEGRLLRDGEVASIVISDGKKGGSSAGTPKRAFAYGTLLLILHGLACWLVGRRIPILSADFRCSEPDFSGEWRVLFSQQPRFDRPETAITFAAEYLEMTNIQNERSMKEFLRYAPANFLVKYKNSASLTAQIRRRLRDMPPQDWPTFACVAELFNMSQATLRRRLEAEGQSYRTILEDFRRDLAISLLSDSRKTVAEIAGDLGFAETSAFHRAFRKWTGTSPRQYRPE